jgi:ubiquinone/menaquinone biosynthesis C-methylase UbiE
MNEIDLKAEISLAVQNVRRLTADFFKRFGSVALLSNEKIPEIPQSSLSATRVYSNRYIALEAEWPSGVKILEVGTQTGEFANFIFNKKKPASLDVIDISYDLFNNDLSSCSFISRHLGRSIDVMSQFPDDSFDIVYIDASHSYEDVRDDIKSARRITKNGGLIVCNDYVWYSPAEFQEYGIIKAVNEVVSSNALTVKYLALHSHGFFDIAFVNLK